MQYLNEIKDSVVAGFQWATKEVRAGVLVCVAPVALHVLLFIWKNGHIAKNL